MIYTILFIILIILIIALYFVNKAYKAEKKNGLDLLQQLATLEKNIKILKNHSAAVKEIKKKKKNLDVKIKEAQTDEEVNTIIADIIKSNNKRV